MVLTWNKEKCCSALLEINLSKFEDIRPLIQINNTPTQNRTNIRSFEFVGGLLFVSNVFGQVSIYRYPDCNNKIGGIYHMNQLSDIVFSETTLVNTGLTIRFVMVLESKSQKQEGSIAIYVLK